MDEPSPLFKKVASKPVSHIPIEQWFEERDQMVDKANEYSFSRLSHLDVKE